MEKQFDVEISTERADGNGYYYATLEMPAKEYEITDALQRARAIGRKDINIDLNIYDCELIPELTDARLDTTYLKELNFFAKRLASLGEEEKIVLQAVIGRVIPEIYENEIISVKDLINSTYGLDRVMIASNIYNDELLGQFVIENDLRDDILALPDSILPLLDKKAIGKAQRESEDGVFIGKYYVVAIEYEMPEIYDGETLPSEEAPTEWYAFRLAIAKSPENEMEDISETAEWISLPMDKDEANRIARLHGADCIEDCVYYDYESAVPQITNDMFSMRDFDTLNRLAGKLPLLSPTDQVKYKAVLEAEKPHSIDEAKNLCDRLWRYQFYAKPSGDDDFFKSYMLHHLDAKVDADWLNALLVRAEGSLLLDRLGATVTDYGVISACDRSLYELVPYYKMNADEYETLEEEQDESDQGMGGMQL